MTREDIKNTVQDIFRDVFDAPNLKINNSTGANNIGNWDSLTHINLLSALQKEFNIKFSLSEIENLTNVEAIIAIIEQKTTAH